MIQQMYQTGPRAQQERRDLAERELLAGDLARWAGEAAKAAHAADVEDQRPNGGRHYTFCCEHARHDADRDMYAFAVALPLETLRRRHASELREWKER